MAEKFRVISWASVFFFLFGLPATGWGEPSDNWSQLLAKAKNREVRVIVQLRDNSAFNKNLSTRQAQTRRAKNIENLQNDFLNSLAFQGHQPGNIKKFSYMPFIAFGADSALLTAMQTHASVVGIEEDVLLRPGLSESVPLIGGDAAFAAGYSGTGWHVAVLDTGVD